MVKIEFQDGAKTITCTRAESASEMQSRGLWRGASYANEDGVEITEYWPTPEQAEMEQACPAPVAVVVD